MKFCKTRGKWQTGRKEGGGADLSKRGARIRDWDNIFRNTQRFQAEDIQGVQNKDQSGTILKRFRERTEN